MLTGLTKIHKDNYFINFGGNFLDRLLHKIDGFNHVVKPLSEFPIALTLCSRKIDYVILIFNQNISPWKIKLPFVLLLFSFYWVLICWRKIFGYRILFSGLSWNWSCLQTASLLKILWFLNLLLLRNKSF